MRGRAPHGWRALPVAVIIACTVNTGCAAATPGGPGPSPTVPPSPSGTPSAVVPSNGTTAPSDGARRAGLIDVTTFLPDAVIDLRYATADNFVGVRLYPAGAKCLVHESMRVGLTTAAAILRERGERIVFWDCYRPHSVQVTMFEKVPNPAWVAAPGAYSRSHETGRSVDVTLTSGHGLVDMGTDFDAFTPQAAAHATSGVTAAQQANRARLRAAMAAGGLSAYAGEWWHFDGPGAGVQRAIVDVPVN
ncbi:M15 family metallopeptidase [Tsukamurella pseudospumae]|uniref:D-alanyl-D-alanine dipeptidase n=1 Tax=Tsukamurella pseudospumae TaxID=239498 RepID=A0A137ZTS8_9ACTN|nr:D-alanyl-D-alanine dipeptidase [Tsukamurella pseudospumae]